MKFKFNVWKFLPAALDGLKAGTEGLELATAPGSDGGIEVTREEAEKIAEDVGKAVAKRILLDAFGVDEAD